MRLTLRAPLPRPRPLSAPSLTQATSATPETSTEAPELVTPPESSPISSPVPTEGTPIQDAAPDQTLDSDATPPTVTLDAPASPTTAQQLTYAITFSEAVTGLTSASFTKTGTATGCSIGAPSGSGSDYVVDVSGCSPGTITLSLLANAVTDAAGNQGPETPVAASAVTIEPVPPADTTPPVVSITAPASPTAATTLSYAVLFGEPVTGLSASDFTISATRIGMHRR